MTKLYVRERKGKPEGGCVGEFGVGTRSSRSPVLICPSGPVSAVLGQGVSFMHGPPPGLRLLAGLMHTPSPRLYSEQLRIAADLSGLLQIAC